MPACHKINPSDPCRDRPRTRIKQILDIFMSVDIEEISPDMTDLEDIFPSKKKKRNLGWKNFEKYNQKHISARRRQKKKAEQLVA